MKNVSSSLVTIFFVIDMTVINGLIMIFSMQINGTNLKKYAGYDERKKTVDKLLFWKVILFSEVGFHTPASISI
jgi:membrane protein insertase Oxa1/YidC/SpoIIIJ